MFCSACGKSIPDESNYCLHCGHKQISEIVSKPKITISTLPAEFLKGVGWNKSDLIKGDKNGLIFWFQLVDKNHNLTCSDCEVKAKFFYWGTWGTYKMKLTVKRSEFGFAFRDQPSWYGYKWESEEPVWKYDLNTGLEIIVKLPNGKELKASV